MFQKIYVEITNNCNLNCSFCSKDNRLKKEITPQEFDTIIKKIKGYTKTLYLHIKGEPLLHKELEKILEIAHNNQINIKITTNGTLLKNRLTTLQKFDNIRQINVSLHSENNFPNYFEDVFNSCDILSKKIPIVYRIWLLNNYELDTLSTIIVDKIKLHYHLDNNFKDLVIKNKNIKIKDNIYLDKDNEFIWPDKSNNNTNNYGTCLGTRSHIGILSNGDVVPCCLDSKGLLKLGNIYTDSLEEIINSQEFIEINQGFKNNKLVKNLCKNCSFRKQKFK